MREEVRGYMGRDARAERGPGPLYVRASCLQGGGGGSEIGDGALGAG
jgi:hypothetical protein